MLRHGPVLLVLLFVGASSSAFGGVVSTCATSSPCSPNAECTDIEILNPSFDEDTVPEGARWLNQPDGGFDGPTSWTGLRTRVVPQGNTDWNGPMSSGDGANYLCLQFQGAFASQDVVGLVPGKEYTLSFKAARRPRNKDSIAQLEVLVQGKSVWNSEGASTNWDTDITTRPEKKFESYSVTFTASDDDDKSITFRNSSPVPSSSRTPNPDGLLSVFVDQVVLAATAGGQGLTCTCDEGYEGDGVTCNECEAGYYCAGAEPFKEACSAAEGAYCPEGHVGDATGITCPAGSYCAGGTNLRVDCQCPVGNYCPAEWTPVADAAGARRDGSADPLLGKRCPPNMFCPGGTAPPEARPGVCDLVQSCGT